jgi:hypothetical protein
MFSLEKKKGREGKTVIFGILSGVLSGHTHTHTQTDKRVEGKTKYIAGKVSTKKLVEVMGMNSRASRVFSKPSCPPVYSPHFMSAFLFFFHCLLYIWN